MKKLFLAFAMLATACCYAQTSHTGITKTKDGADQPWVQLWKGGPKWAMFNVGSSIADYAEVHVSEARLWSSECDNTIHSFSDFIHFGNATMELNSDEYNRYAFSVRAVAVER